MDAWIGHLLTALVMVGGLAGVYAGLKSQIAVLTVQNSNLQAKVDRLEDKLEAATRDPTDAHRRFCQTHCEVYKERERLEAARAITDPKIQQYPPPGEGG